MRFSFLLRTAGAQLRQRYNVAAGEMLLRTAGAQLRQRYNVAAGEMLLRTAGGSNSVPFRTFPAVRLLPFSVRHAADG